MRDSKSRPDEKPQIFVRGPRVTIHAAVLAAAVWVQARFKTKVRAVVVRNDGAGMVREKLGLAGRVFVGVPIGVRFETQLLETVRGVAAGAAGDDWIGLVVHRPNHTA